MFFFKNGKVMLVTIPPHAPIGLHKHGTSDDINYCT